MNKKKYKKLIEIIQLNHNLMNVFDALDQLGIDEYYVGAGSIVQTVWNYLTNKDISYGISDVDIVIYEPNNLERKYEEKLTEQLKERLNEFPLWLDVKNQARVHIWYKEKFGYEISPYASLESAINTWPTSASSIGIRRKKNKWLIYAPFGIDDLFDLTVRANSRQITKEIYQKKNMKWIERWNELKIIDWDTTQISILNNEVIEIDR